MGERHAILSLVVAHLTRAGLTTTREKDKKVKENQIVNTESRKIVNTYTLENGYRVKVATYHYANSKVIRSTISECIARQEATYSMETHRMFADFNEILITERVPRYSLKLLQDQHAKALEIAAPIVEQLLQAGLENARECQAVA